MNLIIEPNKYIFFDISNMLQRCSNVILCRAIVQAMNIGYIIIRIIKLTQNFPDHTREHLDI